MDYSPLFVVTTYLMEGDGFLSICASTKWSNCGRTSAHFVQLVAVAKHRARGDGQLEQALITAELAKTEAGTEYVLKVFHPRTGRMATAMGIFETARWFDPLQLQVSDCRIWVKSAVFPA